MIEMIFIHGDRIEPYEYFCKACLQLRIAFVVSDMCRNCGSFDIVKGALGTLDKDELTREAMDET